MNGNNKSEDLAGFAPASRRGTSGTAGGGGGGGAQSSSSSTTPAPPPSAAAAASQDNGSRITKKKAASTKPSSSSSAATTTKKRSKSSSSSKSSSFGAAAAATGGSSGSIDNNDSNNNDYNEATTIQPIDPSTMNSTSFQPMSLSQIQLRIKLLLDELPSTLPEVPPDYINPDDDESNEQSSTNQNNSLYYPPIKSFASSLQSTIEQYNLLLSLISAATYQWGVDRSGASQQNLSVMNSELQQCQEVITSVVSGRLSNVLCPAVDVLVGRVEIVKGATAATAVVVAASSDDDGENNGGVKENGSSTTCTKKRKLLDTTDRLINTTTTTTNTRNNNEQRINHYTRPLVDPSYVHLCYQIVARNGEMLRYTLATCIHTAQRVIGDYLKAMKKDVGHEVGKGGYY